MKLTREDFQLYDASYYDDWTQVWIQERIFKRKYWLFGPKLSTPDFELILDGDEPLQFNSKEEAEEYITKQIN